MAVLVLALWKLRSSSLSVVTPLAGGRAGVWLFTLLTAALVYLALLLPWAGKWCFITDWLFLL